MRIITSNVEILPQTYGLDGIYKQIEIAGRTSYKSEDKITEDSAKRFVDMLLNRGHTAPLEHGTVYLCLSIGTPLSDPNYIESYDLVRRYKLNPFSKVVEKPVENGFIWVYITTNARVIYENNWHNDLQYLSEPSIHHIKRITVRFICSRSISHELVRHRVFSFVQESTRYCNYSRDKFGNEITFIKPYWYTNSSDNDNDYFRDACSFAEQSYFSLIKEGYKPQEAREVLPNALKTEVVMTGFETDWDGFFKLRCDKAAHPDMQDLAIRLKQLIYNGTK